MPDSLPEGPDLEQLRRRAEELRDAARAGDTADLLTASVDGHIQRMVDLVAANPSLETANIYTASALGHVVRVAEFLAADLTAATTPDPARGWSPLLYAAYSHWSRIDPDCASGVVAVGAALLAAGASPDSHNGQLPNRGYRSALHGAVSTGNSALVRLLLDGGALVDDRVSLREAAERKDHDCLRMLLDHGATLPRTWALESAVHQDDAEGVRLLLEAATAQEPPERVTEMAGWVLGDAATRGTVTVVETLLRFGADPDSHEAEDDIPPVRRATRAGHTLMASVLLERGAENSITDMDRLLGACTRADRSEAEHLAAGHPGLLGQLTDSDHAAIVDAATHPGPEAVTLMLDLGFPVDARNDLGETALHSAAYQGRTDTVRLLLDRGAHIDAHDGNFDSPPLAFATVGSGENLDGDGDWPGTVRVLLDAGADPTDVWLSGAKAPSPDVAEILRSYGVTEEQEDDGDDGGDGDAPAFAPGLASVPESEQDQAELVERLRHAYATSDLELLATLLDPGVRWGGGTGGCHGRDDVIAWYRDLRDRGAAGEVTGVEAYPDGLVVSLSFERPPAGGVAAPRPDSSYQVLRTRNGLITEILGHDDLDGARRIAGAERLTP